MHSNVFETPGVKNIGDRYAAGGASNTHQTGVATPRGNSDNTISNQSQPKGIDTPRFQKEQADQKIGDPSPPEAAFRSAHYGPNNEKGK
ncbi:hypothetical protein BAUCODRAFT_316419 [Baudoinia panamericana UAMH 10762]|uniref:Uncharacterized protein n=1 Tax=Baudoinia panamericana (strain UAMH 10762) TaxID=717646 RepID=M2M3L4_BAUPA|nr:uncharacterized protein BAUCODRAFT_316419 [Baudoinia panamericana UAMH 10762]EMC91146.1 hypothetical protein BAUCODRAFT_316419 [Baudoinia panamericana UAMH 10762]